MAAIKKPIKKPTPPVSKDPGTKDPDIMMSHGGKAKAKAYSGGGKVKKMAKGGEVKNFSKPVTFDMSQGGKVVKKAIKK